MENPTATENGKDDDLDGTTPMKQQDISTGRNYRTFLLACNKRAKAPCGGKQDWLY
jgi:hypothetical protein